MTNKRPINRYWVARILPPECVARLTAAAQVPGDFARRKAVDDAIQWCVLHYPQFFLKNVFN